jgi:transposase-like protein
MKPQTRQIWSTRVARLAESGLDVAAFAAREGVNAHTLKNWRWKLRAKASVAPVAAEQTQGGFVELIAAERALARDAATAAPLELYLRGDLRVVVPSRFDADALRRLVAALEVR